MMMKAYITHLPRIGSIVSVEDLEMPNGCTHDLVGNDGGDDGKNGDGLFPEETLDDETEFTGFTEQDV